MEGDSPMRVGLTVGLHGHVPQPSLEGVSRDRLLLIKAETRRADSPLGLEQGALLGEEVLDGVEAEVAVAADVVRVLVVLLDDLVHGASLVVVEEEHVLVVQGDGIVPLARLVVGDQLVETVGHLPVAALHPRQEGVGLLAVQTAREPVGRDDGDTSVQTGSHLRNRGQSVVVGETHDGVESPLAVGLDDADGGVSLGEDGVLPESVVPVGDVQPASRHNPSRRYVLHGDINHRLGLVQGQAEDVVLTLLGRQNDQQIVREPVALSPRRPGAE